MADRVTVTTETAKLRDDNAPPPPVNLDTYPEKGCVFYNVARGAKCESSDSYSSLSGNSDVTKRTSARDLLQKHILRVSDEICRVHEARIYGSSAALNFGFATTATLLAGAAAVVGGEAAKSALAAAAAAVIGTQGHLNSDFYQNLFAHAIVQKTRELRQGAFAKITISQSENIDRYGVDDAVCDAVNYHLSCSFYEGVVALADSKSRGVKSKADIDAEIAGLGTLRTKLTTDMNDHLSKVANADETAKTALKNSAALQIRLIDADIRKLIVLRASAP